VSPASLHIVFDVGGTLLRGALWNSESGSISDLRVVEAPSHHRYPDLSWPELTGRLVAEMSTLRSEIDPARRSDSVAVAFPGPVDREQRVLAAPTLWGALGQYPFALDRALRDAWPGTSVRVLNDVSAAGYRYLHDDEETFCIVTVSTGVGNKVFVGGRPLVGPTARGGEIGHVAIDTSPLAPLCDCGGRGHVGAFASGRGMLQRAREEAERSPEAFRRSLLVTELGLDPGTLTAEALASAYGACDAWTSEVVGRGVDALASALAPVHLAIGVERFVFIGGFAIGLGARFTEAVGAAVDARCWGGTTGTVSVMLGERDGRCALIGAGRASHLGLLV
jgi:predicted NBD/HSP70 family sugar kinase